MRQKYFSVPHIFKGCRLPETQQQYCPCVVQFMYVFLQINIFTQVSVVAIVLRFKNFYSVTCILYNLIGLVVRALTCEAEVQSSNLTRDCKNILVAWEYLTLH